MFRYAECYQAYEPPITATPSKGSNAATAQKATNTFTRSHVHTPIIELFFQVTIATDLGKVVTRLQLERSEVAFYIFTNGSKQR